MMIRRFLVATTLGVSLAVAALALLHGSNTQLASRSGYIVASS